MLSFTLFACKHGCGLLCCLVTGILQMALKNCLRNDFVMFLHQDLSNRLLLPHHRHHALDTTTTKLQVLTAGQQL